MGAERGARGLGWIVVVLALAAGAPLLASAQSIGPRDIFPLRAPASAPSAEEILRRALDNLFGFDAAIALEIERTPQSGAPEMSEFLVQRMRGGDVQRLVAVSLQPPAVRGNRVLQLNYTDGR